MITKTVSVIPDKFTEEATKAFDYIFTGVSTFTGFDKPDIKEDFNIGVIVGASGTGKSTLLHEFGEEETILWQEDKAIVSHFSTPEEAVNRLSSVGLNSIPSWCKPYHVLSTGEKFRADLARRIKDNAVIDEFTSVVDRNVAKASSLSINKYIRKNNIKNVILATCHEDILEWLEPDWIFNTNNGELLVGRCLQRPKIVIDIYPTSIKAWGMFKDYHYLSLSISKSAYCFLAVWDNKIIGFACAVAMPSGTVKEAWREHRTVILPDYQGMGIGVKLSDAIAQIFVNKGKRYYSRTAHPRMGEHRDNSPLWKRSASCKHKTSRNSNDRFTYKTFDYVSERSCWSHEYIGAKETVSDVVTKNIEAPIVINFYETDGGQLYFGGL
jgi:GNAT superfamily N-acetyltransferase